jgi:hypothetical protein
MVMVPAWCPGPLYADVIDMADPWQQTAGCYSEKYQSNPSTPSIASTYMSSILPFEFL